MSGAGASANRIMQPGVAAPLLSPTALYATATGQRRCRQRLCARPRPELGLANGNDATATGYNAVAIGQAATATVSSTFANGTYATATGVLADAIGTSATATGGIAFANGANATAMALRQRAAALRHRDRPMKPTR